MKENNKLLDNKVSNHIFKVEISHSIPKKVKSLVEKLTNSTYEFKATDNFSDIATIIALFELINTPNCINLMYKNKPLDSREKRRIISILKCYLIYSVIKDPVFCQDVIKFKNYGDYSEDYIKFPCRKLKTCFLRTRQKNGYEFTSFYTPSEDKIKLKEIYKDENKRKDFIQSLAEVSLSVYCPAFPAALEYFNKQKSNHHLEITNKLKFTEISESFEEYENTTPFSKDDEANYNYQEDNSRFFTIVIAILFIIGLFLIVFFFSTQINVK